ncbi:MAG: 4Fe-4S dicluster domain-containing protein [Lachnospira sp.]|nr:4Fe-4S dicluster domain-containing protein [Lachnospira sp.]
MLTNDANILKIKHEVLYQVAKLAYEGRFDEEKEEIAYRLIPGPKPQFRCCIYKEREIVRQRVRLAEGKCPTETSHSGEHNIIQVIESACADCPLSHYIVTDNCRKCMAKACQQSCKFGAISMGRDRAYIDPNKCKECGMCAKNCPYNAIADLIRPCKKTCPVNAITMDEDGICVIDEDKCINCGQCIHACPFGAIGSKTDIVSIIKDMLAGKKVIAMVAPALEGQFGNDISMSSIRTACLKIGFADMVEVGLGGDMTAAYEAEEWVEAYKEGKKKTTSCCPAFVNMIKKHFPELNDYISTTVSPMCAVSRMLKAKDPETKTVFIGPCIAKKSEAQDKSLEGNADYVLTIGEVRAMLRAKEVKLEPEENQTQQASVFGKRFGNGGGVTAAVVRSMEEMGEDPSGLKIEKCSGAAECKKILTLLKVGKLDADFVEGMMCEGGCVGGPSRHRSEMQFKKDRDQLINEADGRGVHENLMEYDMESFKMHRDK